jgi:general secretion pathway protein E
MLRAMSISPELLAEVLQRQGLIDTEQAAAVKKEARMLPQRVRSSRAYELRPLGYEVVLRMGFQIPGPDGQTHDLQEHEIGAALARDAGMDFVRIDTLSLDADLIEKQISRPFARKHRLVPLSLANGKLRVALANPFDLEALDSYRRIAGRDLLAVVAGEPEILKALNEFYGLRHSVKRAERDLSSGIDLGNLESLVRMKSETEIESSDQHIVNAVEFLLQHAYDTRASDIHIEPKREGSVIRFRIDGVLHDIQEMPKVVHLAVVSRIKTVARLDIAEKRRPQDGRMKTTRQGQEIELRVSSLPVAFGEKLVLRIFDPQVLVQDLAGLGFYPDELEQFNDFINRPHGIILVTGPTGSGKTTTLYSALKTIATRDVNVTTIEDPIEMVYEEFNQTAVQTKAGITFAGALRHILRQDPDVIMVGEIRDAETAQYAIQAALTGHLVFSTLHTNDAPSSVSRLVDLGVERFLISSTLVGAMAQRLVRRICPHCVTERSLSADEVATLHLAVPQGKRVKVKEGAGCFECRGTGYLGRSGIFEILPVDDATKHLIVRGADAPEIKREAVKNGMRTLRQSALRKLAEGVTTFEEVVRVTGI